MASTKGSYLGKESERIQAYYKDRASNLRIKMLESRLEHLNMKGECSNAEIDKILEEIYEEQEKLKFGWGVK